MAQNKEITVTFNINYNSAINDSESIIELRRLIDINVSNSNITNITDITSALKIPNSLKSLNIEHYKETEQEHVPALINIIPLFIKHLSLSDSNINHVVNLPTMISYLRFERCSFKVAWDIQNLKNIKILDLVICILEKPFAAMARQVTLCLAETSYINCRVIPIDALVIEIFNIEGNSRIINVPKSVKILALMLWDGRYGYNNPVYMRLIHISYKLILHDYNMLKTLKTEVHNLSLNKVPLSLTHTSIPGSVTKEWCYKLEFLEVRNSVIKRLMQYQTLGDGFCNFDHPNDFDELPNEMVVEVISRLDASSVLPFAHTCRRIRACTFLDYTSLLRTGINDVRALWHLCFHQPIDFDDPLFNSQ